MSCHGYIICRCSNDIILINGICNKHNVMSKSSTNSRSLRCVEPTQNSYRKSLAINDASREHVVKVRFDTPLIQ